MKRLQRVGDSNLRFEDGDGYLFDPTSGSNDVMYDEDSTRQKQSYRSD